VVLAVGALIGGLLAAAIPNQYGVTAGFLAALCAFLLLAATGVFVVVPGQDTLGTLLRSVPLAGAALVVAVLVLLSTPADLRWLWSVAAAAAAGWTVAAVWRTRRSGA
jgi:peptidoglycan/LPS O-acetylase OafA/YrhL